MNDQIAAIMATVDQPRLTASGFANWRQCPWCGKRNKAGVKANGVIICFACGPHTVEETLVQLGISGSSAGQRTPAPRQLHQPIRHGIRYWQRDPMRWHHKLINAPGLVDAWQRYKPLTEQTIMEHQLGYGPLPPVALEQAGEPIYTCRCNHARLVYANLENPDRQATAFRGRQLDCTCHKDQTGDLKWLTIAGGTAWLFNSARLERSHGATIVIAENPIDGLLLQQQQPDLLVLAGTAGAGAWRPAWSKMVAAASPRAVLVWLDNDLIGCPNEATHARLLASWTQRWRKNTGRDPSAAQIEQQSTKAMGPKIARELQSLGVPADYWRWPDGSVDKDDLGSYMIRECY